MRYSSNLDKNILLKNLINIRWVAISGQLAAILIVYFYLNINILLMQCLIIVLLSIIINVFCLIFKNRNIYISENEAFYFLLYDTSQLAILLYLTGGIYNPFSLLLVAPVVISASFLKIGYSIFLSLFTILIVILISFIYVEINWHSNFIVPSLFTYGLIISLIISIIFIAVYVYVTAESSRKISDALNQTQIALTNQKKISEIGSLAAAAAHEFSTPLNTIFLVLNDLKRNKIFSKNNMSDIKLLESEVNRCKKILLNLSKNPQNLRDTFLQETTLSNLVKLNFEKFNHNKINLIINIEDIDKESEPLIKFSDEIMYGVGNIIQNSAEYAKKEVKVNISWDKNFLFISITDDGIGMRKETLDKIGNPYISNNKNENNLGLGIFIAKNLIENAGGKIEFINDFNLKGTIVKITLIRKY